MALLRSRASVFLVIACLILVPLFLLIGSSSSGAQELVVYSGRKEIAIKPVIEAFEKKTGIRVALKIGKTGGFINQLIQERRNPQADVFISTTAGAVISILDRGLFHPYVSPAAGSLPDAYKSPDGFWTGISGRARILMYNTQLIKPEEVPRSVFDLTDPKYRGLVAIASTRERTTLGWLSALVDFLGEAEAKAYVEKLRANGLHILPDNTDVRRGVGNGEFALGLTNSPNFYLTQREGSPVGVIFPDQGPGQMGAFINPNTVSIVRGAGNLDEAKQFVDFILSPEVAATLVQNAFEIPLHPDVTPGVVQGLGDFSPAAVNQSRLGSLAERTLEIFPDF